MLCFFLQLLQTLLLGWEVGPEDAFFRWLAVHFRMRVEAPLRPGLRFFHRHAVGFGKGVAANSRYLPGHFHAGIAAGDLEALVPNFLGNVEIGGRRAERRELIAEVLVEGLKPGWELDH